MDYLKFLADHVDSDGNVTRGETSEELGIEFNGKEVSAALCGQYNYGSIEPLKLNKGPAPRSDKDHKWRSEQQRIKEEKELEELRKQGKPIGYGWGSYEDYRSPDEYGFHWIMLEELLAMDFTRKVAAVRNHPRWYHGDRPIEQYLKECPQVTIEEFMGEDFLSKMRSLVEQGYNRITFWLY